MKKYMYLCLAALSIGIFASCKAKKGVEATFSDLDGSWNIVELNGKVLNPAETNQVIEFDVARHSLSGRAGCNRMMGQIEYSDSRKNIIKFPQVATTRMACPDMSGERELLQALDKVVPPRAQQGVRRALGISLAVTAVLMVPVLVFAPQLTAFFNRKAEVVAYGTLLLRYISPFYLLCCINQIYSGALRGAGNSQVPMVIMLGSFVVFRQIYLYIVSHFITNTLLPLAMGYPAGWLVCSAATLLYYRRAALGRQRLVEDN